MKIAIEAQRIFRKEKHGMDYVALETIREIQKIDTQNEYFILVSPGEDVCLQESSNVHIIIINYPSYPVWEQIGLPLTLKKIKPDLLHCTSNTAPLWCDIPLILTLHDIIFMEKKQGKNVSLYQELGRWYRKIIVPIILEKCTKIITVSNIEFQHICESLQLEKKKATVIHNGYSPHFHVVKQAFDITKKYIPSADYIFLLGNTAPNKNTIGVLKAYSIYLSKSKKKLPLLITGLKEDIINHYLKENGLMHIKSMLCSSGYVPYSDLPAIYSGASIFIYASLREGFGLPILEAMACGTPVITSNISSMPEIAGEKGVLVDPYNLSEIADAILKLENEPDFYQLQREYGLQRVKQFSWSNTAKKVIKIYQDPGQE